MSGPTATTDEIKITRRKVDELSSEVTKLKKEVRMISSSSSEIKLSWSHKTSRHIPSYNPELGFLISERELNKISFTFHQNAALEAQVTNLQTQLTREQEEYEERLAMKDQEISDLRATIEEQSQEYADILEVKIKLDNEIATYRKLLETEEERQVILDNYHKLNF